MMDKILHRKIIENDVDELCNHIKAVIFHVDCIEKENDKNIILIHIEALEELGRKFPHIYPIKEMIRGGQGDYLKIQKKCIDLGLV